MPGQLFARRGTGSAGCRSSARTAGRAVSAQVCRAGRRCRRCPGHPAGPPPPALHRRRAKTTCWLMPHLQAAQRRISSVVPVKSPLIRGASRWPAEGCRRRRNARPRCRPVVWLSAPVTGSCSRAPGAFAYPAGAFCAGGQLRPRRQRTEVGSARCAAAELGSAGAGLGARLGGADDECGEGELGLGDGGCDADAGAGAVLLIAPAGVSGGADECDTGAIVIVGSTGAVIAADWSGSPAMAGPGLAKCTIARVPATAMAARTGSRPPARLAPPRRTSSWPHIALASPVPDWCQYHPDPVITSAYSCYPG